MTARIGRIIHANKRHTPEQIIGKLREAEIYEVLIIGYVAAFFCSHRLEEGKMVDSRSVLIDLHHNYWVVPLAA